MDRPDCSSREESTKSRARNSGSFADGYSTNDLPRTAQQPSTVDFAVPLVTLHIVVPVKHLAESKSRLAPALTDAERQALALRLLHGVLGVVQQAQAQLGASGIVVSPDPAVLALAATYTLLPLLETGLPPSGYELRLTPYADPPLNAALEQATRFAASQGASAVLVLPADLPLLTLADVERLWRDSQQLYSARAMVIAPDSRGQGTNALLVRPPGALPYAFGPGSFQRHCDQARRLGIAWHVHRSARLGLDVDLPSDIDDLEAYLAMETTDVEEKAMILDDQAAAFLAQPDLLMRLGTVGKDGYPQVTPVWYLYADGVFYVTTAGDRIKARNMLAFPKVGFAIDSDVKPYRGLSVRGEAMLVAEGEAARPLTRRIAARYVPAERLDAMVATLMESPRVVFAIHAVRVTKMGSW